MVLRLLKSTPVEPPDGVVVERSNASEADTGDRKIRCPRCRWRPRPESRWSCRCGHVWNTFDTGGRCPGCRHQWRNTMCLHCVEWSPHEDWYDRGASRPE